MKKAPFKAGTKGPHVVIVGGGFGGLYAAKALRNIEARVTIVDRRNFHLFQPLLYQVATGGLSPGDIASPIRAVLNKADNISTLQGEVIDILPEQNRLVLSDDALHYDALIIATGVRHHYFGNEHWSDAAPGLKTVEDALDIRRRIFLAFEAAEREADPLQREAWMHFVLVGGGPTGVELAGALGELAQHTLNRDFRHIDPTKARIILLEGQDRILPSYPPQLSNYAEKALAELGVEVRPNSLLTQLSAEKLHVKTGGNVEVMRARTVIWAAGMQASPISKVLHSRLHAELDNAGRVQVAENLLIPGCNNVYVIGDLASFRHQGGETLPGVAQVAMQQGQYAARHILGSSERKKEKERAFRYHDRGSLAVIGRHKAVADLGRVQLKGRFAWFIWIFVHIRYLIEFDNRILVMIRWAFEYFQRKRGARLITGKDPFPLISKNDSDRRAEKASKV